MTEKDFKISSIDKSVMIVMFVILLISVYLTLDTQSGWALACTLYVGVSYIWALQRLSKGKPL